MSSNKPNIYKTGYNLVTSLDYNHPESSVDKATKVLQKNLKADSALLFKKNIAGKFDLISASNDLYNSELQHIINIYNRRRKRDFDVELNDKKIKRLLILNIPINNDLYALAVTNGLSLNDEKESINILKKSVRNIIMNSELIYKLRLTSVTDLMTTVNNRSSYEQDIIKLSKENESIITFIITDLFRLKHINDVYGHEKGDKYIIETAYILKEVFNDNSSKVYRLGGDEFVIIIKGHDGIKTLDKITLARDKVSKINLGLDNETTMLNVGVAVGYSHEFDDLYRAADLELSNNKDVMYKVLRLDRRK